jgi:hypothetical protein
MTLGAPTSSATAPVTALSVLQPGEAELDRLVPPSDELTEARSLASTVTDALWAVSLREAGRAAAGFLDIDLGDVMLAGWAKFDELREAARRTLGTIDEATVDLAGRGLALRQHPQIQLRWLEQTIYRIPFEVLVEVNVKAVEAVVADGSLVRLTSGRCEVAVSLSGPGYTIGPRTQELDPNLAVDLGDGFRLAD